MKIRRRKTWKQDKVILDNGQQWWIHKGDTCKGYCPFHNPSDHPLKDATIAIRGHNPFSMKPAGFVERICEHGIGHSDPDSVAYYDFMGISGTGIHGCDGCCSNGFGEVQSADSI